MKRKLQIFVSSTYRDLLPERQAAVEAILRAGHIPAGMELFAAGDKSQLETIYRWIDESDVYMLILGGRYGSVEPDSGKAYTQLEYEYAIAVGKRFFAVVLTDQAIEAKVRVDGTSALEKERPKELQEFRRVVTAKICRMVDDGKDIKLAIHETLLEFLREYKFDGWVSGKHVVDTEELSREIVRLTAENAKLKAELGTRKAQEKSPSRWDDFESLRALLNNDYAEYTPNTPGEEARNLTVAQWFFLAQRAFVTGISNTYNMKHFDNFLFFQVAPHLTVHGLTEDEKVAGVQWRRVKTTKKGNEFLVYLKQLLAKSPTSGHDTAQNLDPARESVVAEPPSNEKTPPDKPATKASRRQRS